MPTFFSRLALDWRTVWLTISLSISLAVFSSAILAADVLVVTDTHHPVKLMGGEKLIELDAASRIEAQLSASLSADPTRATAVVKRRLNNGGADLQRRIASAYQNVTDAWSLGITSIPAVVVDQRYVVYGEPDVARAVALIAQHRRTGP